MITKRLSSATHPSSSKLHNASAPKFLFPFTTTFVMLFAELCDRVFFSVIIGRFLLVVFLGGSVPDRTLRVPNFRPCGLWKVYTLGDWVSFIWFIARNFEGVAIGNM